MKEMRAIDGLPHRSNSCEIEHCCSIDETRSMKATNNVKSSWQAIQEMTDGYSVTYLDDELCWLVRIELNDLAKRMIFTNQIEMADLFIIA
jgi:hypothetical protein